MKVAITQESLNKGLNLASRIVPNRPTLPILGNVLLEARENTLTVSATNLEVGISLKLAAQVKQEGAISIPARLLAEFVGSLAPAEIELITSDLVLEVKTQTHVSKINGLDANEFPPLPEKSGEPVISLDIAKLEEAIGEVTFAAATDESRPVLAGVLLAREKDKLLLVATDGFRLSHKELPAEKMQEDLRFILPAKGFFEVERVMKEKEFLADATEVAMSLTKEKNQAIFSFKNAEISCRLLEGQFPDYKKIIPKNYTARAILDREELTKAVKLASIFARDSANIIHLSLAPQEKKITIAAQTKELGNSKTEIEASLEGETMTIAFNARFITDVVSALSGSQISIDFSGVLSPAQIQGVGDTSFFHILMPIRTESVQ